MYISSVISYSGNPNTTLLTELKFCKYAIGRLPHDERKIKIKNNLIIESGASFNGALSMGVFEESDQEERLGDNHQKEISKVFAELEMNFLIQAKKIKENLHLKNGIVKIKMFIEDIFLVMLMEKKV